MGEILRFSLKKNLTQMLWAVKRPLIKDVIKI